MVFSSLIFLFIFLPLFLAAYYISPRCMRNFIFFAGSLIFYAWGEPIYVLVMLFSAMWDYCMGLLIAKNRHRKQIARLGLISSIAVNIALLGFFKYFNFFMDSLNHTFGLNISFLTIALPIGISFYTFQTMSYTIDLYRGKIDVQRNFISFGAYVAMFPQLIAGPIVTYDKVAKELDHRTETVGQFADGVLLFIQGLGKKVLIANQIGLLWETMHTTPPEELSVLGAWLGMIAFALQIYFDFSGYSDMAVGLGKMFGFELPKNFNYPYTAKSVSEFWRRWHMTLTSWFRNYVYIPLGGNRVRSLKLYRNLLIVWFLTGFWHGAGWNFIVWGLYFAFFIILERIFLQKLLNRIPIWLAHGYLLLVVLLGWVFFASDSLSDAGVYLKTMFGLAGTDWVNSTALYSLSNYFMIFLFGFIAATPLVWRYFQKLSFWFQLLLYVLLLLICTAYLVDETYNPFLYFRF